MFFSTMQTEGNIVEIAVLWYLTSSVIRSGSVFFQFDFTSDSSICQSIVLNIGMSQKFVSHE